MLEPHLVADLLPEPPSPLLGHPPRRGPRRDPPRLQHDDLQIAASPASPAASRAGGTRVVFPAPVGANQNGVAPLAQGGHEVREDRVDGEWRSQRRRRGSIPKPQIRSASSASRSGTLARTASNFSRDPR